MLRYINPCGLIALIVIMIPNVAYASANKGLHDINTGRVLEVLEQAGRFSVMALTAFNIPLLDFGYIFPGARVVYYCITAALAVSYCAVWPFYMRRRTFGLCMSLVIIPSCMFLVGGILRGQVLTCIAAVLFAVCHIIITYRSVKASDNAD